MTRKQLYVTDYQSDSVRSLAHKDGITMSEIMRRALDTYIVLRTNGTTLLIKEKKEVLSETV